MSVLLKREKEEEKKEAMIRSYREKKKRKSEEGARERERGKKNSTLTKRVFLFLRSPARTPERHTNTHTVPPPLRIDMPKAKRYFVSLLQKFFS